MERLKAARTPEKSTSSGRTCSCCSSALPATGLGGRDYGEGKRDRLVIELYLGQRALENPKTHFESRAHFLAYAARSMRRLLAAQAKRRVAVELLDEDFAIETSSPALKIALDEALEILSKDFPRAVNAYQLRDRPWIQLRRDSQGDER